MPKKTDPDALGKTLFLSGLTVVAISSSFSITLAEGGLILTWIGFLLRFRQVARNRRRTLLDYLVVIFLAWQLLSALMSPHRSVSLRAYRSEWLVLTYFLVSYGMGSLRDLERLLKLLGAVASILAIYAIVQHFTGVDYIKHKTVNRWRGGYQALGLLGHHITFGIFYAWVFSITLSVLVSLSKGLRSRIFWTLLTCLSSLAILYSYSRAAWVGALSSAAAIAILKKFRLGYSVLIIIAVLAIAVILEPSAVQRATTPMGNEPLSISDSTRILLLKTSLRMIQAYPIFGIGPGTFTAEFDRFKVDGQYVTNCHPHNDLLNFAVRSGLTGLAIFVAVILTILTKGVQAYRAAGRGESAWLPLALVSGMIGVVFSGLFQCNFTDSEIAIQAWLIAGSVGLLVRAGSEVQR